MARLLCLIKVSVIIISSKIVLTVFMSSDFISRRCSIKDWIFIFEHLHDTDNDRNNYNNQIAMNRYVCKFCMSQRIVQLTCGSGDPDTTTTCPFAVSRSRE